MAESVADEQILYELSQGIATIKFNRPEKLNTWTASMEAGLRTMLAEASRDPEARVIVMTGAGRAFCAGADLSGERTQRLAPPDNAPRGDFEQRYSYMLAVPKPIIAAINGAMAGVGLCLALYSDLRYMAQSAKLNTAFARRGLIAEHGSSWLLPRLIGPMNAMELLLTGKTIDAQRAADMGLVNLLPDEGFLDRVLEVARELATFSSPRAMSIIKRQVIEDLSRPLGEAAVNADIEQFQCFATEDLKEGIASFLEKRPPNFKGLSDA
jgi:enoyl-CoA hydratase/carnithine racemase